IVLPQRILAYNNWLDRPTPDWRQPPSGGAGSGPHRRITMTKRRSPILAMALTGLMPAIAPASADDFYKGKLFTIVVGFSPAGGFDSYARVLSRYIWQQTRGNPPVLAPNMPGEM